MPRETKADLYVRIAKLEKELAAKPKGSIDYDLLDLVYKRYPGAAPLIKDAIK